MESQNMTFGELLTELKSRLGDSAPKNDAALTSFLQEAHDIMWCQLNPISTGQEERPRFTQPQDKPGVSDRLVLLYALALAKSHFRLPDAQVAVSAYTSLLRLEKIRKHQLQRGAAMTPVKDCRTCQFMRIPKQRKDGAGKRIACDFPPPPLPVIFDRVLEAWLRHDSEVEMYDSASDTEIAFPKSGCETWQAKTEGE